MDGQHYSGLGSIFDTESEDTAHTCIFILPWIHFQAFLLSNKVSEVSKDLKDNRRYSPFMYLYLILDTFQKMLRVSSPTLTLFHPARFPMI